MEIQVALHPEQDYHGYTIYSLNIPVVIFTQYSSHLSSTHSGSLELTVRDLIEEVDWNTANEKFKKKIIQKIWSYKNKNGFRRILKVTPQKEFGLGLRFVVDVEVYGGITIEGVITWDPPKRKKGKVKKIIRIVQA